MKLLIDNLNIILPIAILILAFLLKLFIDRNVEIPLIIRSIYELPVDIIFLSISFIAAFTISTGIEKNEGLFYCFVYLIVAIINVIIWRRTIKLFERGKTFWSIILTLVNFFITI